MSVGDVAEVFVADPGSPRDLSGVLRSELLDVFECSHGNDATKAVSLLSSDGYQVDGMTLAQLAYHAEMDIEQIRRSNWDRLWQEYVAECEAANRRATLRQFATDHGISDKIASNIRNRHKKIGNQLARRIEQQHQPKLERGWMDRDHSRNHISQVPQNQQGYIDMYAELLIDDPKTAQQLLVEIIRRKKK